MEDDQMRIKLQIDGNQFPITIERSQEEVYRRSAKRIDSLLNMYREKFNNQLPKETILTMVAFQLSLEKEQLGEQNDCGPYTEKITALTKELEAYIQAETAQMPSIPSE